jgi:hypothetical protein
MVSPQELFFVAAYAASTAILFHGHLPFWKASLMGMIVVVIAFTIKYLI